MRAVGAICAAVFASACTSSGSSRLELEGLNLDYGFLVILDQEGTPTRVTAPFGISDEETIFGALPAIKLVNDESTFVLIGLSREQIAETVGGFQLVRVAELGASLNPPPNIPRKIQKDGGTVLSTALPSGAKLFSGVLGSGVVRLEDAEQFRETIARRVTLEFPIDPEYCRIPNETPLAAFTDTIPAFGTVLPVKPNVVKAFWLGTDRLFTVTWTGAAILRPGRALEAGPNAVLLSHDEPTPHNGLQVITAAIDPRTRNSTVTRALVGGLNRDNLATTIWELEIRGDEIRVVFERTDQAIIGDIAILYDGRQIVSAPLGQLYERNPNTGELTFIDTLSTHFDVEGNPAHLTAVDDDRYTFLASTQGRVHVYDAVDGIFRFSELFQEQIAAFDVLEFSLLEVGRTENGELEIWAGAERGTLFRKIGDHDWVRIALQFPPSLSACIAENPDSGEIYYLGRWWDAALTKDYIHILPYDCAAVLQVRRSDLCVSVLPRANRSIEPTTDYLSAIDALEGQLATGGDFGNVYLSTW